MVQLPNTIESIVLVQGFLYETRRRISNGVEIASTNKANEEPKDLALDFGIGVTDIDSAFENLSIENYF
jgi:hypothetical protein